MSMLRCCRGEQGRVCRAGWQGVSLNPVVRRCCGASSVTISIVLQEVAEGRRRESAVHRLPATHCNRSLQHGNEQICHFGHFYRQCIMTCSRGAIAGLSPYLLAVHLEAQQQQSSRCRSA